MKRKPSITFQRGDVEFLEGTGKAEFKAPSVEEKTLSFHVNDCKQTLRRVQDEYERMEAEGIRVSAVAIPVSEYAKLYAFVWAYYAEIPTKEAIESYIGEIELVVTEHGPIRPIPEDSDRLLNDWVFDETPYGQNHD